MNKAQVAALLLTGAAFGAGGKQAVDRVLATAVAAPSGPIAHAVDLRRDYAGENFRFSVYANREVGDAGYIDIGHAKKCRPLSDETKKQLLACMNAAGASCEW